MYFQDYLLEQMFRQSVFRQREFGTVLA